jgi:hypothetical protein
MAEPITLPECSMSYIDQDEAGIHYSLFEFRSMPSAAAIEAMNALGLWYERNFAFNSTTWAAHGNGWNRANLLTMLNTRRT